MAIDETGLTIKRLPEILEELEAELKLQFGEGIDVSTDSLLGILNSIYGASIAEQWSLSQAVYNAFNIETAEGKQLDDLVNLVGINRLPASPTQGEMEYSGQDGTTVPAGGAYSDSSGNNYTNVADVLIDKNSATRANIGVVSAVASTAYTITVDGLSFDYTTGATPTIESIVGGLVATIGTQTDYTATANIDNTEVVITANTVFETFTLAASTNLTYAEITSVGDVQNALDGNIAGLANTITSINTPVVGLDAVNNPLTLTLGSYLETDEELRKRHKDSVQIAGSATVPAIEATVGQIAGVSNAVVIENRTPFTDGDGRPSHSYETIVEGGLDQDIADAVWETKPAGVETYGNVSETVTDSQGNIQTVKFSRPTPVYIWVKVDYTKYDEESFPNDGEDGIKQAIEDYGNALGLGEDAIPKRFYGSVYTGVSGIEDLTITFAVGTDEINQPSAGAFTENAVDIAGNEDASFDISRVQVTLV